MKTCVIIALFGLFVILPLVPAKAQLLSDHVQDNQRECTYVGSTQLANGDVVPRGVIVPASQPCPDFAPYYDPNRPAPGNAALLRETVEDGNRQCVYSQGGVEYVITVALAHYCAQTPDLLTQELSSANTKVF